jgi:hypothetical protein
MCPWQEEMGCDRASWGAPCQALTKMQTKCKPEDHKTFHVQAHETLEFIDKTRPAHFWQEQVTEWCTKASEQTGVIFAKQWHQDLRAITNPDGSSAYVGKLFQLQASDDIIDMRRTRTVTMVLRILALVTCSRTYFIAVATRNPHADEILANWHTCIMDMLDEGRVSPKPTVDELLCDPQLVQLAEQTLSTTQTKD